MTRIELTLAAAFFAALTLPAGACGDGECEPEPEPPVEQPEPEPEQPPQVDRPESDNDPALPFTLALPCCVRDGVVEFKSPWPSAAAKERTQMICVQALRDDVAIRDCTSGVVK